MGAVSWAVQAIKYANRIRRDSIRRIRLKKEDVSCRKVKCASGNRVLLISVNDRFGDSLFVMGLAHQLRDLGRQVSIATIDEAYDRYYCSGIFASVLKLDFLSERMLDDLAHNVDVVVDLEYTSLKYWEERAKIVRTLRHSCAITVQEICKNLNIFDIYVNYREAGHISLRMGQVLSAVCNTKFSGSPVLPFFMDGIQSGKTVKSDGCRVLYLNALAGDADRCLSSSQFDSILGEFLRLKNVDIYINPPSDWDEPMAFFPNVHKIPKLNFIDFCKFAKIFDYVVTPDTSVTHIASFWNCPSFVIFPPNDRDFYHEFSACEVWGALADKSISLNTDDPGLVIDQYGFGYPNFKARPISSIENESFLNPLRMHIQGILN